MKILRDDTIMDFIDHVLMEWFYPPPPPPCLKKFRNNKGKRKKLHICYQVFFRAECCSIIKMEYFLQQF